MYMCVCIFLYIYAYMCTCTYKHMDTHTYSLSTAEPRERDSPTKIDTTNARYWLYLLKRTRTSKEIICFGAGPGK